MMGNSIRMVTALVRRQWRDIRGASAVEFALLGPIFVALLIAIPQVGIYMQSYNAVQSVVSDSARKVIVAYQTDNKLTDAQIRSLILARAVNAPYILESDRLVVNVDRSGTSRVTGAIEIDVNVSYTLIDLIPGYKLPGTVVTYSRPIFVAI